MKKKLLMFLCVLIVMSSIFTACTPEIVTQQPQQDIEEVKEEAVEVKDGDLKTGLAVITSVASSKDAGEEDGLAQSDVNMAAVTVDRDGKIVECIIDSTQIKMNFNKEGKLMTDPGTEFLTKQELGDDYGMKKASSIGKEWNEQANAFAEYCVGKTVDEIMGIAITEDGLPDDAQLAASCTVYIGGFQAVVAKAVENAMGR